MKDPRYDYVHCVTCGKRWQQIDFGCVAHVYFCDNPQREIAPYPFCRHRHEHPNPCAGKGYCPEDIACNN